MSSPIALLVSDIDGTLVANDKSLPAANADAVRRLRAAGIAFSLVSSRPPRGLAAMVAALGQTTPIAAFNGGMIVTPDLQVVTGRHVDAEAARTAIALMQARGVDVWLFTDRDWFVLDPEGAYVPKERRTVGFEPVVLRDFEDFIGRAGKLVGSSQDFDLLAACEAELQEKLGRNAEARRSQTYYLDVTPAGADKGNAVRELADTYGVPLARVAVIGDQGNDVPMFEVAGVSIAMGNGPDWVKAKATYVTTTNEEAGFAAAIDAYVLGAAKAAAGR